MKIDHIIDVKLLGQPSRILVEADLQVVGEEVFYYITGAVVLEIGGFDVEIEAGLDNLPPDIRRQTEDAFDHYVMAHAVELAAAESDWEADLAFERWKEEHDHD